MGVEDEFGINHKRVAAIVHHFRAAEAAGPENITSFYGPLESYIATFGPMNFAALEMIFRENNFNTHLVAIPAHILQDQNPDMLIVDVNDLRLHNTVTPVPFVIGFSSSLESAEKVAEGCGFVYDTESNLQNLRRTGVCTSRAEVGLARPDVNLGRLGLPIRTFSYQPKGNRHLAEWN